MSWFEILILKYLFGFSLHSQLRERGGEGKLTLSIVKEEHFSNKQMVTIQFRKVMSSWYFLSL